jgi:geranylgeranyl diphosphate synthase type I
VLAGIEAIIEDGARHLDRVNRWAPDLRTRLLEFASRGKLIRGALVATGAEVFGAAADRDVYRVAAAMELIQSFLLIHDDIMDEDSLRRGQPAIFEQYRQLGVERSFRRNQRFSESMGICAGDVAMLLAFEGASTTGLPAELQREVVMRLAQEIADVGVAQMADVANGHTAEPALETEILSVYRYKTGRYTFSLPLMLGGVIAGAAQDDLDTLGQWGELEGIIFQIRDDQLGLLGSEEETGKPAGSDIISDKQTIHRLLLQERAAGTNWQHVLAYFGARELPADAIEEVREALDDLGVIAEIDSRIVKLGAESDAMLESLTAVTPAGRETLGEISAFNRQRTR